MSLPPREQSEQLLKKHVTNDALRHHCHMVASAMEAYAQELGEDRELWYQTGLLHDLDWEEYPDEHPHKAVNEFLVEYPEVLRNAILAHGPERTGREPETLMERYLFACDELSGFLHAYALMRPEEYVGMKASKVRKKLKDKAFAANVSREDITKGFELIESEPAEHIQFLIEVFSRGETE
jgi:putative nucleotidyltransferase with HDIG domain